MKSTPNLIGIPFRGAYVLSALIFLSLIVEDAETAHPLLIGCISSIFVVLISPVLRDHNVVNGLDHICLQYLVSFGRCGQTWGSIDLDQPRFAVIVKENIEAVQLEAVLVVDDDTLDTLQGHYDEVVDVFEAFSGLLSSVDHLEVEFQTFC